MRIGALCLVLLLVLPACWKRTDSPRSQPQHAESPANGSRDSQQEQHASPEVPDPGPVAQSPSRREASTNEAPLSPREIAALASPGVVTIEMTISSTQQSQGSGFYVRPAIVATNYHVVEGATTGVIRHHTEGAVARVDEVVAYDEEWDVALLSVAHSAVKYSVLSLGHVADVAVGDQAFVMGSPHGFEATFSQGIVSSLRGSSPHRVIQLTTPISQGSSGGPVLNEHGQVIGLATGTVEDGQNLNFAVPVTVLRGLLATIE